MSLTAGEVRMKCESRPNESTIHRWSRVGIKVNGVRVKLKRRREGGRFVFLQSDLDEFLSQLNGE